MQQSQVTYPLMENADDLRAASGRPLNEITLESVTTGALSAEDVKITGETLRAQAQIAREGGFAQLAANLSRAAELTVVPNEILLEMYETLRPGRATLAELTGLAETLEQTYQALENARYVREAATVYQARGLLRREADGNG